MSPVDATSPYTSVESDGFTVSSNTGQTADQMTENLATPKPAETVEDEAEKVKKAAATLGEKGGKASAKAKRESGPADDDEGVADRGVEADSADSDGAKPLGKPRDDPRARMLEATRKEAEAKRELAAERAEKQRLAAELAEARRGKPTEETREAKPQEDAEPQEKDFDNYAEYVKAVGRWSARQEHNEARQRDYVENRARVWAAGVDRTIKTFTERTEKIVASDPTFREKVAAEMWDLQPSISLEPGQSPQAVNVIADEILASEQGPLFLLHFTEHPDEFQRIATLRTPREVARAMAIIESKLGAVTAGVSSKPTASTAKPPVRPVTGSHGVVETDDENLNFEEFVRRENAREAQQRKGAFR